MSNRILKSLVAASLAFTITACGDDNGLGPAIQLTEAETEEMMTVLGEIAFGSLSFPEQAGAAIAQLRNPNAALATVNFNQTLDCPVSGSRHTNGSMTTNDAQTQITASFTQTYSDCAATSEAGTVWTFNTAPSLTLTLNATNDVETETISLNMNFNGGFQVASDDGRSGSCVITLAWTMNMSGASETLTASVNGTVCGRAVSETIEITG